MKLGHIQRLCNIYIKKNCQGCPGNFKGRCMFGPKPPMQWENKEMSHFITKVQEAKTHGSHDKSDYK